MQFIVESDMAYLVFTGAAVIMLTITIMLIFIGRRSTSWSPSASSPGFGAKWVLNSSRLIPALISFAMMFIGMALVGAWYYVKVPIYNEYNINLLSVTAIAGLMAVVVAFGLALFSFYASTVTRKGRS